MDHSDLLTDAATVINIIPWSDERPALILDRTIFYPQGGGQPYDQGIMTNDNGTFEVQEVRFQEGIVYHIGKIVSGTCKPGDTVTLQINKERRDINSKNHTAGHIIDIAMRNLGITFIPTRGYHFPEGAYVEYEGTLEELERAALEKKLQEEVNKIVAEARPVEIKLVSLDELKAMASYVPNYIPKDKPSRAMIIQGYPAIPCGGTHATSTAIGTLTITKIKNKSGNLRVGYAVN
jgi:Ser-tRNA(Ala) deacylase AlaX